MKKRVQVSLPLSGQQNDLKAVMKKIEELLPLALPSGNANIFRQSLKQKPFARIGIVPSESFAFQAVNSRKKVSIFLYF